MINENTLANIRALTDIAAARGQSLAQLAISWTLRNSGVTSALVGASSVQQLEANLASVQNLTFSDSELSAIDKLATDMDINLWKESSDVA
jgi:L-glyceraldehyde 3-phosphate reductase